MPATAERLSSRDSLMAFNLAYPEPGGDMQVLQVVCDGTARVAAEVEVTAPDAVYRCAAFWRSRDGLLADGVDYWVRDRGEPPPPYRRKAM
jgi:ketosteroid isomerase-like protein